MKRIAISAAASIALFATLWCVPAAALADDPSYATGSETIRGTIASVQDVNHFQLNDDRGFTDDITLRSGASVFPNGVRLEPGQRVTINGRGAGPTFLASSVTTSQPRDFAAAPAPAATAPAPAVVGYPVPAYYPVPYYYPAPVYYGYPAPIYYGYRPAVSVGLFFHIR